ncbi:AfsR/SARP family transcriptional regulator [Paractinoplanes atraurantiacus]|uniref:AfsR/SARP family transcriptional regulator n=1 Tax=Paractinoplanes atraurantiacus TaxID=1036182 RepID=UPI0015CEF6D2|nr:BTAD domain-containing putative transcriptional regulator [Actinoplanes atraurantiacus]
MQVLGPLRLWRDDIELDGGPPQQRCLLALLLIRAGRPVSLNDLVRELWGSDPPASAINVIHKYVGVLRRLLEPDLPRRSAGSYLLRHGAGYRFVLPEEALDLTMFRRLVTSARVCAAEGRPSEAFDGYVRALRHFRGPAGDAPSESATAAAVFANVDAEFFDAVVAAANLAVLLGRAGDVLVPLRMAAEMDRLNEPVHAGLITTLAAAGHQAEALARYGAIRDRLIAELGINPGPELAEAHRQVLARTAGPSTPETVDRPFTAVRPAQLPPGHPLFVGRRIELGILKDLYAGMRDGGRPGPMVIAVDGVGGVGKSAVVARFAHTVAGDFTDGQLFLDLRGHQGEDGSVPAGDALRRLLYGLGGRPSDIPDTFDALAAAYRGVTAGLRLLVVLDNVRDPSQIRPLLPNSPGSLVLITSRRPLTGLAASGGACLVELDRPDRVEARELLTTRLGERRGEWDPGAVDGIVERCGRLPLALVLVAARLRSRAGRPPGDEVDPDLRTVLAWSYRQLSPGAARLFRLLSVVPAPGAPAAACVSLSGHDPVRARAELDELAAAALVSAGAGGRFSSPELIRTYAGELLRSTDSPSEIGAAVDRLLEHYLHSSLAAGTMLGPWRPPAVPPARAGVGAERPASYREALDWFARHREVLKEAVRLAAEAGRGVTPWHLALTIQPYLELYGFFQDWDDVMRLALRAAREQGDVIGEASVLRCLAGARSFAGAHQEALDLLETAVSIFAERDLPAEVARVYARAHAVHTALGRHDRARADSERAIALAVGAGDGTAEIDGLTRNGRSLTALGQYDEADRVLRRALDLAGRGDQTAPIRVAVARNLAAAGRVGDAVQELERASAGTAYRFEVFSTLADLLMASGDQGGARGAYEKARAVLGSYPDGGPDHMRAVLDRLGPVIAAGLDRAR